MPVLGTVVIDLLVGDHTISHEFWVAGIDADCILGLDFLRKQKGVIDVNAGTVSLEPSVPKQGTSELHCRIVSVTIQVRQNLVCPYVLSREALSLIF